MIALTLQSPYAVIVSAIWGIIMKITQAVCSSLGGCLVPFEITRDVTHEYNTESGFAEPFGWLLHPEEWGCGVSKRKPPKTAKEQVYWQVVRLLVLKRDNNQCQNCGVLENLCVHHLSYQHQGNELEHLEDLTTLCRSCHGRVHEGWKPDKSKSLPKRRFDPDGIWRVDNWGGGSYGDLDRCIETLFEIPSRVDNLATRKQVRNRCLEVGYVSINGWVICFVADDGESTLDMEVE